MPRLVINYKPLNEALEWIRYPIPNRQTLLTRISGSRIFSKFDMKSGFWQIKIAEEDKYKTAFVVPMGHYEWNVMPFGLKNAPSEFQRIMDQIIKPIEEFAIVYIDDILIFSKDLDAHTKHLEIFRKLIEKNGGMALSTKKRSSSLAKRFSTEESKSKIIRLPLLKNSRIRSVIASSYNGFSDELLIRLLPGSCKRIGRSSPTCSEKITRSYGIRSSSKNKGSRAASTHSCPSR